MHDGLLPVHMQQLEDLFGALAGLAEVDGPRIGMRWMAVSKVTGQSHEMYWEAET